MKTLILLLSLFLTACTAVEAVFQAEDVPLRPAGGYMRSNYLKPYIGAFNSGLEAFPTLLNKRTFWEAENPGFEQKHPHFNIGFSYFQNSGSHAEFSFAERLFFADVFDLIRYAVNSEVFAEELLHRTFYENDGLSPKSPEAVLKEVREISFATSLAKRPLGLGVLAEASVGGYLNVIWVRDDVDYSKEKINEMAVILLHEITHNLGYAHPSQVNYGMHYPCQEALRRADTAQVEEFIALTPYHEPLIINRVRTLYYSKAPSVEAARQTVSCHFSDIFPKKEGL